MMPVWKAVAQIVPFDPSVLGGAAGAFVFTVGYGVSNREFERSVSEALERLKYSLVDLDDVATIDEHVRYLEEEVASSWLDVARDVEHSGKPYFDQFHVYNQAN